MDKWGEISQQEVNDSGTSRDTLEYIRFMEFRAETESMMALLKVRVKGDSTLQTRFRKLPDGAMFDAMVNYNPETKGKLEASDLSQILFSSELDAYLFGVVSMRLSGDRRRTFRTGRAPQKFISGLCALAAEFQVSKTNVQRRAREALLELTGRPYLNPPIAKVATQVRNSLSTCWAVGINYEFEALRTTYEQAISVNRRENMVIRQCLAQADRDAGRNFNLFLTKVTTSLHDLYAPKEGKIPTDAAAFYTQMGGGRGRGRGKGRGKGRGGARGGGRGGAQTGGRGGKHRVIARVGRAARMTIFRRLAHT